MTELPEFDDALLGDVVLFRMLMSQMSVEELENEGYTPSFKAVTALLAYIEHLEDYVDWLEETGG